MLLLLLLLLLLLSPLWLMWLVLSTTCPSYIASEFDAPGSR